MLKTVSLALVCAFVFLSITNAFWYQKTPEQASEYIYNIDIQVIQEAFDRYEDYVRMSVDNVSATYEDTKAFFADIGDDLYEKTIDSLKDFDFGALIDLNDGDISQENIVVVFREFFVFALRFGRNLLDTVTSFVRLFLLLFKLLWYGVSTISVGIIGIFDVLFTFVSLFKGSEGVSSPTIPDIPIESM